MERKKMNCTSVYDNKRNSNIELLRIIAMLMIIAFHIEHHCISMQLTDYLGQENDYFCFPGFSKKLLILVAIAPMGQVANAIFILISGYFLVNKGNGISLARISKKLLLQLGFAAMILGTASIVAYNTVKEHSIILIDFNAFNNLSWFVGYYFIVIVFAKLFLNRYLDSLSKKNYMMFLLTLFALLQFEWSRNILARLAGGLEVVLTGIFLYSLGGFVRKYNPFEKIRTWAVVAVILAIILIVCGNYYITTANKIMAFHPENGEVFTQSIPEYYNFQFIPIALGVCIFELFRRMKLPDSRVINYLGAATFMVYLFHDNDLIYKIWGFTDWITLLHDDVIAFMITYLIWTLGTFGVGVVLYTVYIFVGKLLQACKPFVMKSEE